MIVFVYENNAGLAEAVPLKLIDAMAELIQVKKEPRILRFFKCLVRPNRHEGVVPANQDKVVEALVMHSNHLKLEFPPAREKEEDSGGTPRSSFWGTPYKEGSEEGDKEFSTGGGASNGDDEERKAEIKYHILSVELLALCAKGRNAKSSAKNQSLLSLSSALNALYAVETRDIVPLKAALVKFIQHTFIDTPLVDQKLGDKKEIPLLVKFASKELQEALGRLDDSENERLTVTSVSSSPPSTKEHFSPDLLGLGPRETKDYVIALLQLMGSVLDVIFQSEIKLRSTYLILNEVRKILTKTKLKRRPEGHSKGKSAYSGEIKDNHLVEECRLKCLNVLEMKDGGVVFSVGGGPSGTWEWEDEEDNGEGGWEDYEDYEDSEDSEDVEDDEEEDEKEEGKEVRNFNEGDGAVEMVDPRRRLSKFVGRRPSSLGWNPASTPSIPLGEELRKVLLSLRERKTMDEHSSSWTSPSYGAFLSKVEDVAQLTDPEDKEYLEAGMGFSLISLRRHLKRKQTVRQLFLIANARVLKVRAGWSVGRLGGGPDCSVLLN